MTPIIDDNRLLARLRQLGEVGRRADGRLARLAATDEDKAGRDLVVGWLREAGLEVVVDRIGNIFGIWSVGAAGAAPVMLGSHIDSVVNAGIYDGCYGVIAGIEAIASLKAAGVQPVRPLMVGAFTNEEGARYTPDMMGSLVYAGGLSLEEALVSVGTDGSTLGRELERIGYAGQAEPGFVTPYAFLELHIEQGPVLERRGIDIGAVENLQGISWQKVTINGVANHAGTTPMTMRCDAGYAAASVVTFLRDYVRRAAASGVATVGSMTFHPNVINVIPSRVEFTVDLRDTDEDQLRKTEAALRRCLDDLAAAEGVEIFTEMQVRFEPVAFDDALCCLIEQAAARRGLSSCRMTSGAGHDAQMLARICPSAMIFVPSRGGISHNPREHTDPEQLLAGARIFLDVVHDLVTQCHGDLHQADRGRP